MSNEIKQLIKKRKGFYQMPWNRVEARETRQMSFTDNGKNGVAVLIHFIKVNEAKTKLEGNRTVTILDNGYYWLRIAMENENYMITAMYDGNFNLVQYYFDMTAENGIYGNEVSKEPYFIDLFLDVVVLPSGEVIELDIDELDGALQQGNIKQEEHDLAISTATSVKEFVTTNREKFDEYCRGKLEQTLLTEPLAVGTFDNTELKKTLA